MSFEEYLLFVANGDSKLALDHEFRKHHASNWLRYLKEQQYENNTANKVCYSTAQLNESGNFLRGEADE